MFSDRIAVGASIPYLPSRPKGRIGEQSRPMLKRNRRCAHYLAVVSSTDSGTSPDKLLAGFLNFQWKLKTRDLNPLRIPPLFTN